MPRDVGEQLGPYQILAPLGAGGMGEVYKARDTRLDRLVAVKVLPDHIAQREDARARFEREARAVASLNHPNICTLFDIGPNYMVMELIEGETLAARIEKGALPLEQALTYATQIADALDRAHRAGVTHRDIKPHNIMLTRDGVKVLDFGLAKSTPATPTDATLTKALTTEGTLLGTPQYMAPEQFEGKEADARTDIWAFGAVLYEMMTGQKAFEGKTYSSLVGAILGGEPAPMAVKPFTPAWLERLVRRCLAKDPEDRYQAMRDIVLDLQAPVTEHPPAELPSRRASRFPWMVSALLTTMLVAVAGLYWRERTRELPQRKLEILVPNPAPNPAQQRGQPMAISPDGRRIAYLNGGRLWVREMSEFGGRELTGTDGAGFPFWSPDSSEIAYFVGFGMWRVAVVGGAPKSICSLRDISPNSAGAAWVTADTILFTGGTPESPDLYSVPAGGGEPKVAVKRDPASESDFHHPSALPDGRGAVFVIHRNPNGHALAVTGGSGTKVALGVDVPSMGHPVYSPSGHILFHRAPELEGIWALPFSLSQGKATGEPFLAYPGSTYPSVARDGTLLLIRRPASPPGHLVWVDRNGKLLEKIAEARDRVHFVLSPDGKRLAVASTGARSGIQTYDLVRGTWSAVAKDGSFPVWSPAGDHLAFTAAGDSGNSRSIVVQALEGRGEQDIFAANGPVGYPLSFSPDGNYLLYTVAAPSKSSVLYVPLKGDRKPVVFHESSSRLRRVVFSPDGSYVAIQDGESIRDVHLKRFPSGEGNWQVSANGASWFVWSRKGDRLFYSQGNTIWEVEVSLHPAVRLGAPRKLFDHPNPTGDMFYFDVSPDGNRFILRQADALAAPPVITVVENWFEAFRNRK